MNGLLLLLGPVLVLLAPFALLCLIVWEWWRTRYTASPKGRAKCADHIRVPRGYFLFYTNILAARRMKTKLRGLSRRKP